MSEPICLRPHHFLCIANFQDKGYSVDFVNNFKELKNTLEKNPQQKIKIVDGIDSICSFCPCKINAECKQAAKVALFDQRHIEAFGFNPGTDIMWEDAESRIKQRLTASLLEKICQDCIWKPICKKNLDW